MVPEDQRKVFSGEVRIENRENESDFEIISVYLKTPRSRLLNFDFIIRILDRFPILQQILTVLSII